MNLAPTHQDEPQTTVIRVNEDGTVDLACGHAARQPLNTPYRVGDRYNCFTCRLLKETDHV